MPIVGSIRHDFNGRRRKKVLPKGEVYQKMVAPEFKPLKEAGSYRRDADIEYKSVTVSVGSGCCSAPPKKTYTGTLVKGISTMHKSNAVPIIDEQEAKDHANMRR
jgi:hypothetical protein